MSVETRDILYLLATGYFALRRDSLEDRVILQKTIYLLQAHGLQLGYGFSWYTYGPSSQDLLYDSYKVLKSERELYEQRTKGLRFSEGSLEKFEDFKNLLGEALRNVKQLELLGSVDFVCKTWYPEATIEDIGALFLKHKKEYYDGTPIQQEQIITAFALHKKLRGNVAA